MLGSGLISFNEWCLNAISSLLCLYKVDGGDWMDSIISKHITWTGEFQNWREDPKSELLTLYKQV